MSTKSNKKAAFTSRFFSVFIELSNIGINRFYFAVKTVITAENTVKFILVGEFGKFFIRRFDFFFRILGIIIELNFQTAPQTENQPLGIVVYRRVGIESNLGNKRTQGFEFIFKRYLR